MILFVQEDVDIGNSDIFSELKYHLQTDFADQADTHKYKAIMQELDVLAERACSLAAIAGGINTDEKFWVFREQVEELLILLQDYVPNMFKGKPFFAKVFY